MQLKGASPVREVAMQTGGRRRNITNEKTISDEATPSAAQQWPTGSWCPATECSAPAASNVCSNMEWTWVNKGRSTSTGRRRIPARPGRATFGVSGSTSRLYYRSAYGGLFMDGIERDPEIREVVVKENVEMFKEKKNSKS